MTLHKFTIPGTRCTVGLTQPRWDYKNKNHRDADGNPEPDFVLMQDHIDDITSKMLKCTGKHKRTAIRGGTGRVYPPHGAAMNTRDYVERFYISNGLVREDVTYRSGARVATTKPDYVEESLSFFEPLSTNTQMWPDEPLFEECDE